MSIINDQARKVAADVSDEEESDVEEEVTGEGDDTGDDLDDRPLIIPSPEVSEAFDSPPTADMAIAPSNGNLHMRTTAEINVLPVPNDPLLSLTCMFVAVLYSSVVKNSR